MTVWRNKIEFKIFSRVFCSLNHLLFICRSFWQWAPKKTSEWKFQDYPLQYHVISESRISLQKQAWDKLLPTRLVFVGQILSQLTEQPEIMPGFFDWAISILSVHVICGMQSESVKHTILAPSFLASCKPMFLAVAGPQLPPSLRTVACKVFFLMMSYSILDFAREN